MFELDKATGFAAATMVAVGLSASPLAAAVLPFDVTTSITAFGDQLNTRFEGSEFSSSSVGGVTTTTFDIKVTNNSVEGGVVAQPIDGSGPRLSSWGFEAVPFNNFTFLAVDGTAVASGVGTDTYGNTWEAATPGSFPAGVGSFDACLQTGNTCQGSGDGLVIGQSASFRFSLTVAEGTDIDFGPFAARYQQLGLTDDDSLAYVPLPAPFLLLLGGLGGLGLMSRRREAAAA